MKQLILRSRVLVALAAAAAPLLAASPALAQPVDEVTDAARQRFQEGVELFDKGRFKEARAAFLQAYLLKRHPAVLLNLAQSELRSGYEHTAAMRFVEFLKKPGNSDPAMIDDARKGLNAAKSKVGELTIQAREGAEIFVDNEPAGTAPLSGPVYVTPGSHRVEVRLGTTSDSRKVTFVAGQAKTVAVGVPATPVPAAVPAPVAPKPSPAPAAPPPASPAPAPEALPPAAAPPEPATFEIQTSSTTDSSFADARSGKENPWQWAKRQPLSFATAGLGVVGLGASLTTALLASSHYDNANEVSAKIDAKSRARNDAKFSCGDASTPAYYRDACQQFLDARSTGNTLRTTAVITGVVGGAALVGTAVWYFLDRDALEKDAPVVSFGGSTDGGNITVTGRF